MRLRGTILTGLLGAAFLFAGAGTAQAQGNCVDRIRNEQYKLQRDIRRHGFHSRQAEHRREKISRLSSQCGIGIFGFRNDRGNRWNRRDNRRWWWDGFRWRSDARRDNRWRDRREDRWRNRDRDRDDRDRDDDNRRENRRRERDRRHD